VLSAHGGRLFLWGIDFVVLKMVKVVASMLSTMRLQLKLMPRKKILAMRTRIFDFCCR
jgi:hypothetical protein